MRLLLAEDEKALSRALKAILERDGYMVDAVYDGQAALDCLDTGSYDGAVLDIMMPALDGIEVLRRLRARGDLLPVLLLTAKSETDDKVQGLDSGANDYLTKPFAVRELLARVRAMTRAHSAQTDSRLTLGNITLDRATFALSSPTGSFRLANREFQMLEMLLCSPGHVIPEDRFMERIWAQEGYTETSVVRIYISYLQKKLKALHASVRIRTVQKAGYVLEVEE
ncbi:MAG: response regulator transcription factor [Clostridiaceae bacterium]|nr:response regulator transcription factor [Clostridiaceae bacterium]